LSDEFIFLGVAWCGVTPCVTLDS